jgi:hypothetical protein
MPKNLINAMSKYANRLWWTHWMYTPEFADFVTQHSFAVFFMIRDPRDQIVSMARMVQHGFEANQTGDLEQIILDLIDGRQCHFLPWGVERNGLYPIEWEMGVVPFYQAYMPWTTRPKVLVVKFEDLVGPSGGGSSERQLRCIQEIGSHMGSALSPERAQLLAATLFGESATFSEGKIGSWKQHFTQQMKDAFAKAGGIALLQRLGYES